MISLILEIVYGFTIKTYIDKTQDTDHTITLIQAYEQKRTLIRLLNALKYDSLIHLK